MSKPDMVTMAEDLENAFQAGSDSRMLTVIGSLVPQMQLSLSNASDRTLTYAAPQIAALAKRVGYLEAKRA